jgi:hypothetical protein
MCVCVRVYVRACACVCVCAREREREKERACVNLCIETNSIYDQTHQLTQMHILLSLQNYPCGPLSLSLSLPLPLSHPSRARLKIFCIQALGRGRGGRVGSGRGFETRANALKPTGPRYIGCVSYLYICPSELKCLSV